MTLDVQNEEWTHAKQFSFISPIFIYLFILHFEVPSDMHRLLSLVKRAALHASNVLQ